MTDAETMARIQAEFHGRLPADIAARLVSGVHSMTAWTTEIRGEPLSIKDEPAVVLEIHAPKRSVPD